MCAEFNNSMQALLFFTSEIILNNLIYIQNNLKLEKDTKIVIINFSNNLIS